MEKKQDHNLPKTNKDNTQKQISKDDQEIIDQVKKLPLSEKQQEDIIATMEMYSGPIPHPKILAGYQALYPNAAKKIIENGLDESRHRRHLETARQKKARAFSLGINDIISDCLLNFYDRIILFDTKRSSNNRLNIWSNIVFNIGGIIYE